MSNQEDIGRNTEVIYISDRFVKRNLWIPHLGLKGENEWLNREEESL
jgi:hypothetical protein